VADFGRFTHVWVNPIGSILPIRCSWCRRQAAYTLTRQDSNKNVYADNVCAEHASEWEPYAEGEQIEMEFE